jgi:hypothetical protein
MKKTNKLALIAFLCVLAMSQLVLSSCQEVTEPDTKDSLQTTDTEEMETNEPTESGTSAPETDTDAQTEKIDIQNENEIILTSSGAPIYQVSQVGGVYGSGIFGVPTNHSAEIDLKLNTTEVKSIQPAHQTVTFQIGNETLTAQYEETLSSAYYQDSHDCYAGTTESGERFVARFHTESRQLTFFKYSSYEERELSKPILTESECRVIAEKFLFEDMNVSGEYETKVTYQEIPEFANGVYICRFQRVVDQIETDEYAEVHVAERGRVILYRAHMLGAMDGIRPAYQEEEIRSSIEHKLADIYASVMAEYTCTYEITDMRLTRLYEDGQLYLACSVNVYVYRSGGEFDYTESPYLFVSLA